MKRKNLERLRDLLKTVPQENFEMREYRSNRDVILYNIEANPVSCGTAACAAGWIPALYKTDAWRSHENFGTLSSIFTGLSATSPEWYWLFFGSWKWFDNTPLGAAKRIQYLLDGNELGQVGDVHLYKNIKLP